MNPGPDDPKPKLSNAADFQKMELKTGETLNVAEGADPAHLKTGEVPEGDLNHLKKSVAPPPAPAAVLQQVDQLGLPPPPPPPPPMVLQPMPFDPIADGAGLSKIHFDVLHSGGIACTGAGC
jgi:hypothetical protein